MKNEKYNHTERDCSVLWNIVVKCSVDGFNQELSDEQLKKYITKFRDRLDKLIDKKLSKKIV